MKIRTYAAAAARISCCFARVKSDRTTEKIRVNIRNSPMERTSVLLFPNLFTK